ncbi:MAG: sensor histidine kinase N-terminal domain-containing protein [Rhodospirillales bacterium]|nr:sensor histidine kinase N-terminal domain-containing protein [candidate division KSB1 bacterium]MCB9983602.1 sensor histidine kinase N-terminal domain-containing protein [Rhodospirillales bacterium]
MQFFQTPSLKKRLLVLLLGLILVVWGMVTVSAYVTIRAEMRKLLDTQIAQVAYSLLEINLDKIHEYEAKIPEDIYRFLREDKNNLNIRYQIWKGDKLLLQSLTAPDYRLNLQEGFSDVELNNNSWRALFISVPGKKKTDVIVMAHHDIEDFFLHPFSEVVLVHMAAQMLFIAVIVWFAVGHGLRPLKAVAGAIGQRHYNDLSPIEEHAVPKELKPVVYSVNKLFDRLKESFDAEKQFTNHAAHELRTPLAALKMQAQVAIREKDRVKQKKQLQNVVRGVNRATHLVSQLLFLARLEPESEKTFVMSDVSLLKLVKSAMNAIRPAIKAKNIKLHVPEQDAIVKGDATSLEILIKNLLDNAVRYSPEKSNIHIRFHDLKERVEFILDDEGSGIPEHLRTKIFERFYRISGTKQEGIGIGLSIVKKIADLHKAEVVVDQAEIGTRVIVSFLK